MRKLLVLISISGLCLTVIPSLAVLNGNLAWETHSSLMVLGMVLWFASAPFWFGETRKH